jgi:hypothetical protein
MFHPSSYHYYARLVIASFGLHRAGDSNLLDMPAALARLQSSATHLIECFENDFDTTGFTRGTQASLDRRRKLLSANKISLSPIGCPDFVFTALTYGAVSLLKVSFDAALPAKSVF